VGSGHVKWDAYESENVHPSGSDPSVSDSEPASEDSVSTPCSLAKVCAKASMQAALLIFDIARISHAMWCSTAASAQQ